MLKANGSYTAFMILTATATLLGGAVFMMLARVPTAPSPKT
jgi:hypothetical protein